MSSSFQPAGFGGSVNIRTGQFSSFISCDLLLLVWGSLFGFLAFGLMISRVRGMSSTSDLCFFVPVSKVEGVVHQLLSSRGLP